MCTERYKDDTTSQYNCSRNTLLSRIFLQIQEIFFKTLILWDIDIGVSLYREHIILNVVCQNVKLILIKYFRLVQPNIRLCCMIFDLTSAHDMLILPGKNGLISVICFLVRSFIQSIYLHFILFISVSSM